MSRKYSFDHTEKGLRKTLKKYQEIALRSIWASEEGLTTAPVWRHVNEVLSEKGESRSRASIIFLDDMWRRVCSAMILLLGREALSGSIKLR